MSLSDLERDVDSAKNFEKAKQLARFFKTGKGEYGEGDVFVGITVPKIRKIAKEFEDIGLNSVQELLNSEIHEKRLLGLIILTYKWKKSEDKDKKEIFDFYLKNTRNINNWDLVDLSAPNIVGNFLIDKNRDILYKLAKSNNLWERRIAVLACFSFIREKDFQDCLKIFELLLKDEHDLIHKAVGWMLREIGKRDVSVLRKFLDKNSRIMPRVMLRYSIEKLDKLERDKYMEK